MYYVLSAGTNLGDRLANLTYCREALDLVPGTHVVSASAVYQTQPVGYARQDDFYNVCFLVESRLNPHEMLGVCLGLEAGLGRVRGVNFRRRPGIRYGVRLLSGQNRRPGSGEDSHPAGLEFLKKQKMTLRIG